MSSQSRGVFKLGLIVCVALGAWAEELVVESLGNGRLQFNQVPDATCYRVEWARSASGPWRDFRSAISTYTPRSPNERTPGKVRSA